MIANDKVNILLVDDQPGRLVSYEAILSDLGENLVKAQSGAEALQLLMKQDIAVVLLDVSMPGMDGFETATLIHEHPRFEKIPIIFVTGVAITDLDRLKGYGLGAVDYVYVPVVPTILHSKVAVFVELHRQRRELKLLNAELALEAGRRGVLLKEIHHRVKNSLQVVSSLLFLQSAHVSDPNTVAILTESQSRVKSIALIHEKLYRSTDLTKLDFAEYVPDLIADLFRTYGVNREVVTFTTNIEGVFLEMDSAIPCGLIINELVSNVLKHAFPTGGKGKVHIALAPVGGREFLLTVQDDGVGLPKDFDSRQSKSLGLKLVMDLTKQLEGKVELDTTHGTTFKITFRAPEHEERK